MPARRLDLRIYGKLLQRRRVHRNKVYGTGHLPCERKHLPCRRAMLQPVNMQYCPRKLAADKSMRKRGVCHRRGPLPKRGGRDLLFRNMQCRNMRPRSSVQAGRLLLHIQLRVLPNAERADVHQ